MSSLFNALWGCDGFVCCIGCLSLVPGVVERVVNQVAFMPPRPPGYHVTEEKDVFLIESDYGLTQMPDLSNEGIWVETVRMWTSRGNVILGFHFHIARSTRTLLFSHGNSTDIGIMFHHLKELCATLTVDVFAYEYSGYGESTGEPSEADLYSDIEAAYDYLTQDCHIRKEQIVCYGQSIGSVPSVDLASKAAIGGVILHSALKSGLGVIHDVSTTYWFDVFQNAAKIKRVRSPVFVFHGTHDMEVPFEHGTTLYESCPPELAYEPWWVREAGHNDIEISFRPMYIEQLKRFLKSLDLYFANDRNWKRCGEAEPRELEHDADNLSEALLMSRHYSEDSSP
uniref:AB hydrolase-1 domain-containing protein n=1 Tax=Alexandrium monilatum TaxID=311494 RepID=A0A7S4UK64_9DINO